MALLSNDYHLSWMAFKLTNYYTGIEIPLLVITIYQFIVSFSDFHHLKTTHLHNPTILYQEFDHM